MADTYEIDSTFVHLGADRSTVPLEVTETFWSDLVSGRLSNLAPGRMLSCFEFDGPWDSWEVHPKGDEIVFLLSGRVEMTLERPDGGTEEVAMSRPGEFVILPRGTWHTARTDVATRMLFITDGEGTEHRPV